MIIEAVSKMVQAFTSADSNSGATEVTSLRIDKDALEVPSSTDTYEHRRYSVSLVLVGIGARRNRCS